MAVKPIPDGYHSVTPYIYVRGAADAIAFYEKAFGAVELMRLPMPGGMIGHAEIRIGNSVVMLSDEMPEWGNKSPQTLGGTSAGLMVYVPNVDALFAQAVAAGASVHKPLADQFYGDRSGSLLDPYGHNWTIATHTEDVPHEEMAARMDAWIASQV